MSPVRRAPLAPAGLWGRPEAGVTGGASGSAGVPWWPPRQREALPACSWFTHPARCPPKNPLPLPRQGVRPQCWPWAHIPGTRSCAQDSAQDAGWGRGPGSGHRQPGRPGPGGCIGKEMDPDPGAGRSMEGPAGLPGARQGQDPVWLCVGGPRPGSRGGLCSAGCSGRFCERDGAFQNQGPESLTTSREKGSVRPDGGVGQLAGRALALVHDPVSLSPGQQELGLTGPCRGLAM